MGYRVESYSLNELHRIAVPGAVAPSLFWALPVGDWNPGALDELWRWFTERPSMCNEIGLLLVKDMRQRQDESANVSLAPVGAKLSALMPAGVERFVHPSAYGGESPRILVLSGGYPQPGWGVLVEWPRQGTDLFEDLLRQTTRQVDSVDLPSKLHAFTEAAEAFHYWQNLRTEPAKQQMSTIEEEIHTAEIVDNLLHEAQTALSVDEHRLVGEKLIAAKQGMGHAAWWNIPEDTLQPLLDAQRTLLTAASVLAVSEEVLASEIEPKLQALLADPGKRNDAFRNLPSDTLKYALSACLHLRSERIVEDSDSFQAWAKQILAEVPITLGAGIVKVRSNIEAKLVSRRGVKVKLEREYGIAMNQWRQSSKEARERFHVVAEKAAELQWKLGPQFLVVFEGICRQNGLWVRSIPWDPARMVGWKIMASQVRLDSCDLRIAAQELAPGAAVVNPRNGTDTTVADGSYFTDYVHYIAISRPGFSPRAVTRDLLARLIRPAEMIKLIQAHGGKPSEEVGATQLAEGLLHAFGWRQSVEGPERPLAGCILTGDDNRPALSDHLTGNDLRIVLESFCKDVVDVVVTQLGYDNSAVWGAIEERIPEYRPSSRTKNWEEEVRLMTVGTAVMVLSALGSFAFPAKLNEIKEFAASLRDLSDVLNRTSHHREGNPASSEVPDEVPELIRQLLGNAEAFIGELPWHLNTSFVYGEQPKVLSGEAWNHGSPTPRLLRVIVWTGASIGSQVTLWNRTRRNPIVTDPVLIVRPRKEQ